VLADGDEVWLGMGADDDGAGEVALAPVGVVSLSPPHALSVRPRATTSETAPKVRRGVEDRRMSS
jgi:hypothetical protein